MNLRGKIAVVTGSTSGIGLGVAQALASAGADIALNGFGDMRDIERLMSEIVVKHRVRVMYHPADLAQPGAIAEMMAKIGKDLGGIDILVNNAGIQHVAPLETFSDERWDAVLAVNLSAAFHTIKAALPDMRRKGWGRIVNIGSVHGLVASAEKAAYVAAKHGLIGLTKVVGLETAGSGITCTAICPGWVLTPLVQRQIDARAQQQDIDPEAARISLLSEKQPSRQFVTPEQIGAMVLFLCSSAAEQMTGCALPMDGGWTAQ